MTDEKKEDIQGETNSATYKEEPKKVEPEKTFTLTASELKKLMDDRDKGVERELNIGDWQERKDIKGANKTARMKLFQKDTDSPLGLIIDWKFLKNEYDENTRQYDKAIYKITVLYDNDSEKEVQMTLLDFAHINNYEKIEIIETKEKKMVKVHGQVARTKRSREGYSMSPHVIGGTDRRPEDLSSDMVDLEETRIETTVKIKRPNGETLTLNSNRLNA